MVFPACMGVSCWQLKDWLSFAVSCCAFGLQLFCVINWQAKCLLSCASWYAFCFLGSIPYVRQRCSLYIPFSHVAEFIVVVVSCSRTDSSTSFSSIYPSLSRGLGTIIEPCRIAGVIRASRADWDQSPAAHACSSSISWAVTWLQRRLLTWTSGKCKFFLSVIVWARRLERRLCL